MHFKEIYAVKNTKNIILIYLKITQKGNGKEKERDVNLATFVYKDEKINSLTLDTNKLMFFLFYTYSRKKN